jgi:hypothetical protein
VPFTGIDNPREENRLSAIRPWEYSLAPLNFAVAAGIHEAFVAVFEPDEIRRLTFLATYFQNDPGAIVLFDGSAVHMELVTDGCLHRPSPPLIQVR